MKKFWVLVLLLAECLFAQEAPFEDRTPVDVWLGRLKRRAPEEHQRMCRMRRRDPGRFAGELSERVQRARLERVRACDPRVREFLDGFPLEEQMEIVHKLRRALFPGIPEMGRGPEIWDLRREIRELSDRYRRAMGDLERDALREQIRARLSELFDRTAREREETLRRLQATLDELRARLEERLRARQEWLEQRLRELTENEEPPLD